VPNLCVLVHVQLSRDFLDLNNEHCFPIDLVRIVLIHQPLGYY
jgi:hypothetical protein